MFRSSGLNMDWNSKSSESYLTQLLELAEVDLLLWDSWNLRQSGRGHLLCKILFSKVRVSLEELFHIFLFCTHGCCYFLFSQKSPKVFSLFNSVIEPPLGPAPSCTSCLQLLSAKKKKKKIEEAKQCNPMMRRSKPEPGASHKEGKQRRTHSNAVKKKLIPPLLVGWVDWVRESPEEKVEGWIQTIPLSSADSAEG